ncbi:hypothetical protein FGRMN_6649 [Fusarium graminum]|nr:hypothetical protein FGRMN_6649 [Fusarium graminum]
MDVPPAIKLRTKPQDSKICAHKKLDEPGRIEFPVLDASSNSCSLCCLYKDVVLAVICGSLPILKEANRPEAEGGLKIEESALSSRNGGLVIRVANQDYSLFIFRDGAIKENNDFTIQGRHFPIGYRVGRYTNSKTSFEHAQEWLSECLTSHGCPKPSTAGVPLPKRLLDVQGNPNDPIRLIETQGTEYPYVCLSHRWGDPRHKQLKTTTRTILNHMNKIEWHELPATFQDVVTVCRSMGIEYLWIDSLCILQSFPDITPDELDTTGQDFAQENSTMARTYQNSHFTISADLATYMDSGIFSKFPIDEHEIEVTTDDGDRALLYVRLDVNHHAEEIPSLETRGWVLQEFLLPPRVIHFGAFDIEWRCKTRLTCECVHLDREPTHQSRWHRHHFIEEATNPPPNDPSGALSWWEKVVHHYTSRQLTNPSDKLPALSGLAQQYKQVRGGTYLAGLWQDSLIHDLCWYHVFNYNVPTSGGVGHRPAHYRAPSWSWASLDTDSGCSWWWPGAFGLHPVIPGDEPKQACVILESSCEPATSDPTGEVSSGFLDMEAALISAEICQDPEENVVWSINRADTALDLQFFKPDCELEDENLSLGDQVFCAAIAETIHPKALNWLELSRRELNPGLKRDKLAY